jgi:hypothetical protein
MHPFDWHGDTRRLPYPHSPAASCATIHIIVLAPLSGAGGVSVSMNDGQGRGGGQERGGSGRWTASGIMSPAEAAACDSSGAAPGHGAERPDHVGSESLAAPNAKVLNLRQEEKRPPDRPEASHLHLLGYLCPHLLLPLLSLISLMCNSFLSKRHSTSGASVCYVIVGIGDWWSRTGVLGGKTPAW